ncbi:putative serine/threonine protein kinase [Lausannevirus]|uniref:Putative serine/threonine protein kinase n=2 Tax=Lausannevirus TaxID=999883 RepID=A0A0N9P722_9VIRU|nr:putative serine/threonine protein kinase [Lausannevirus]AEA07211.1 putative serine/threonine protein kinase [Lausannevirus]ALH07023.1 putative serine/threonine protein kinase [Port-miou virus]
MNSIIKVEAEGKTHIFRGKDDVQVQCKLDDWVDHKVQLLYPSTKQGEFVKVSRAYGTEEKPLEVEFYEHLKGTGLTPRLLRYGDVFCFRTIYEESGLVLDNKYCYFATELFGKSLEQLFGPSKCMVSSEELKKDKKKFDETFPPSKFPEEIRSGIRQIIARLSAMKVNHQDFHTGNILMDKYGTMKVIDFEVAELL